MSTLKVDTIRPVTTDGSLTLQGDSSGAGVTGAKVFGDGSLGADSITDLDGTGAPDFTNGWKSEGMDAYACRAWVNFRGTSQSGTATASGLVSGQYTATVTSASQFTVVYSGTTYTINTSGNHEIGDGEGVDLTVSGTTVTIDTQIRASGNVSSITDNGTGSYAVNLTNAMPDVNYSVAGASSRWNGIVLTSISTSSSFVVQSADNIGVLVDASSFFAQVFR